MESRWGQRLLGEHGFDSIVHCRKTSQEDIQMSNKYIIQSATDVNVTLELNLEKVRSLNLINQNKVLKCNNVLHRYMIETFKN